MTDKMDWAYDGNPKYILLKEDHKPELLIKHGQQSIFIIRKPIHESTYISKNSEPCYDKLCQECHKNPIEKETCNQKCSYIFFPVQIFTLLKYNKYCYNRIFNVEPLYLIDKIEEIGAHIARPYEAKKARPYSVDTDKKNVLKYRIDFSFENDEEVKNILKGIYPDSFTRGHYKKSIN